MSVCFRERTQDKGHYDITAHLWYNFGDTCLAVSDLVQNEKSYIFDQANIFDQSYLALILKIPFSSKLWSMENLVRSIELMM